MPRGKSPTTDLARKFVEHFLKVDFDFRFHGRIMAEVARLINPKDDDVFPVPPDIVWGCLLALEKGMFGYDKKIENVWCVTYGNTDGNYIKQYLDYCENPPPFYEADLIRDWENLTGKHYPRQSENDTIRPYLPVLE